MGKTFVHGGRKNYDRRDLERSVSLCKDKQDFRKVKVPKKRRDWEDDEYDMDRQSSNRDY